MKKIQLKWFITSTKPWITRIITRTETLSKDMAPGMAIFKTADVQMAKPNILFAGITDARKPPGICVIKYPQKNDESTILSVAAFQCVLRSVCKKCKEKMKH